MESYHRNEVAEAIDAVDAEPFLQAVRRYLKESAGRPPSSLPQGSNGDRKAAAGIDLTSLEATGGRLRNDLKRYGFRLIRFSLPPQNTDLQTRLGFRSVKSQQLLLIHALVSAVEAVRQRARFLEERRALLSRQGFRLFFAADYLRHMEERMVRRPTTMLRLDAVPRDLSRLLPETVSPVLDDRADVEIDEMNRAIDAFQSQEDRHAEHIRGAADDSAVHAAVQDFEGLLHEDMERVAEEGARISRLADDLKQGAKLMLKLVDKGHTSRTERMLVPLLEAHRERLDEFRAAVLKGRRTYFMPPKDGGAG